MFNEIDRLQRKILELMPFSEEMQRQLKEYYRVGLTYSSNAIEGNSLTLSETKVVLEDGLTVGGKPLRDHLEAKGHSDAYDWLYDLVVKDGIEEEDIFRMHYLFYRYLDENGAGNGRVARLLMNLLLFKENYPITIVPPIRRPEYIATIRKANHGDAKGFTLLIADCVKESQKELLRFFR